MTATSWQVRCADAGAMRALGRQLARALPPGSLLALRGDLAAGKTTLVQGLAQGLGGEAAAVTSPTYTLLNEYLLPGGILLHLDLYRLEDAAHAAALGLDEQMHRRDALIAVEWSNRLPQCLPPQPITIALTVEADGARCCDVVGMPAPAARSE